MFLGGGGGGYVGNFFTDIGFEFCGYLGDSHKREIKKSLGDKFGDGRLEDIKTARLVSVMSNSRKQLAQCMVVGRHIPD